MNETLIARLWRSCQQQNSPSFSAAGDNTHDRPPLTTTEKEKSFNSFGESEIKNIISNVGDNTATGNALASTPDTVQLLHDVYGEACPGEMVALMGSSGAGKSTLLDILADRKTTGTISGQILFNGEERSEMVAKASAYVMQDNVHIGMLTVRETLYFAAELRLDEQWDQETKKRRVDKVIAMLGLSHVQHTIVGTDLQRGISGGQLKRLSIGVEIINLPDILFLDEPTTGLDAALAFEVMASIKTLAQQNRTIICTIHQPSPQTFELFDRLLLLSAGRVVYFGATKAVVDYFSSPPLSFPYQRGQNPADYVVNIASLCSSHGKVMNAASAFQSDTHVALTGDVTTDKDMECAKHAGGMIDLASHFLTTEHYSTFDQSFNEATPVVLHHQPQRGIRSVISKKIVLSQYTSVWNQVRVLCSRTLLMNYKNKNLLFVTFLRHVVIAIFYGTIYFQLPTGTSQSAYSNRLCLFFFSSVFLLVGHQSTIPSLHQLRLVFYRERGSRAYGSFAYWLSNWVFEVPMIAVNVFAFGVILHVLSGLRNTSTAWCIYLIVLFINSLIGLFVCHFVAAIASSTQAAVSIYPVFLFFSIAFAGFIIYLPDFPAWLGDWAPYLSFMRYSMQAMSLNEFHDNDELPFSELFLDSLGYSSFTASQCVGYQSLFILLFGLLVLVAVEFVSFEVR